MKQKIAMIRNALTLLLAMTLVVGCQSYNKEPDFQSRLRPDSRGYMGQGQWPPHPAVYTQRFVWKVRLMAERLASKYPAAAREQVTILMTTFVNVDDLSGATSFGRLLSEQMMTELNRVGFTVVESRKAVNYAIREKEGEFLLTRDLNRLAESYNTDLAFVGTYLVADEQVLLNSRLVTADSSLTTIAATAQMNLNGDRFLSAIISADKLAQGGAKSGQSANGMRDVHLRRKVAPDEDPYADTLDLMIHSMVGAIDESVRGKGPLPASVAVTTFVDVDNLYRAATFGRFLTDRVIAELTLLGYAVREIRVAPDLFTDVRIGELGLTRELSQIVSNSRTDAVVVGTYTRADSQIVVNGRMIATDGGGVMGAGEMVVDSSEQNSYVTAMLKTEITSVPPQETVEGY